MTNQHLCITCTYSATNIGNCMISPSNHSMPSQYVFLLNSPPCYRPNLWSNLNETSGKLRQCIKVPEITTKGAKKLQSFVMFLPPPTGTTLCSCTDILVVRFLVYKGGTPYKSRTSRKTIRLLRAKIATAGTSQVL